MSTFQKLSGPLGLPGLKSFHDLFYSWWDNGVYCFPSVLIGHEIVGSSSLENLYKKLYQTWSTAVKTFKNIKTLQHEKCQILLTRFIDEYRGKEVPINKVFDSTNKESIKKAMKDITPIVDTVKLGGRQNVPLRDDRDNTRNHPEVGKSGLTNSGNFADLLMHGVRGAEKNHLHNAQQNAKYTSPDIQNELMKCCRDVIVEQIIGEVKQRRCYSILADEVTYCSSKEQLTLIFRFVDKENNIREEFVPLLECSCGSSAQS